LLELSVEGEAGGQDGTGPGGEAGRATEKNSDYSPELGPDVVVPPRTK